MACRFLTLLFSLLFALELQASPFNQLSSRKEAKSQARVFSSLFSLEQANSFKPLGVDYQVSLNSLFLSPGKSTNPNLIFSFSKGLYWNVDLGISIVAPFNSDFLNGYSLYSWKSFYYKKLSIKALFSFYSYNLLNELSYKGVSLSLIPIYRFKRFSLKLALILDSFNSNYLKDFNFSGGSKKELEFRITNSIIQAGFLIPLSPLNSINFLTSLDSDKNSKFLLGLSRRF